jgi:predicted RNA-binding protein (virulence factor B family)
MASPEIGKYNRLRIQEEKSTGLILDGGPLGPLHLVRKEIPADTATDIDDEIDVFVALDSEDQLYATTRQPLATVGEFALLRVVDVASAGAFLDWGLPKDLLLPFREQIRDARTDTYELVYIDLDRVSQRLVASAKLKKFVGKEVPRDLRPGDNVDLLITERTDLGWKAIVDNSYWGLLRVPDDVVGPTRGQRRPGFINQVRLDGLVDLSLEPPGYQRIGGAAEQILQQLADTADGFLPLHDKSDPQEIRDALGISKKVFKQAIGALFKQGKLTIGKDGLRLVEPDKSTEDNHDT